jgi:hypothetical protein
MFATPPATPVTVPVLLTLAVVALDELQTPPETDAVSIVVDPEHTAVAPLIVPAEGSPITETAMVSVEVPQPLVTE